MYPSFFGGLVCFLVTSVSISCCFIMLPECFWCGVFRENHSGPRGLAALPFFWHHRFFRLKQTSLPRSPIYSPKTGGLR